MQAHERNPGRQTGKAEARELERARQVLAAETLRNLERKQQTSGRPLPQKEADALAAAEAGLSSLDPETVRPGGRVEGPGPQAQMPDGGGRGSRGDGDAAGAVPGSRRPQPLTPEPALVGADGAEMEAGIDAATAPAAVGVSIPGEDAGDPDAPRSAATGDSAGGAGPGQPAAQQKGMQFADTSSSASTFGSGTGPASPPAGASGSARSGDTYRAGTGEIELPNKPEQFATAQEETKYLPQ